MLLVRDDDLVTGVPVQPLHDDVDGGGELRREGELIALRADHVRDGAMRRVGMCQLFRMGEQERRAIRRHILRQAQQLLDYGRGHRRHAATIEVRAVCE